MRRINFILPALLFSLAVVTVPATAQYGESSNDIVDVAAEAGSFNTLLAAAEAAGLVDVLRSEGPFTVFAPTDEAFAALPEGTVEALLADPDALREILLYHVVSGKVMATDVAGMNRTQSVQGSYLEISVSGETVTIADAQVVSADIEASNGVIHVINAVMLPNN